ncbi:carotenoid-cleaving dioxygenase, mitochondrial-like, partial [Saccoglossus kowalevskii]|uniref:Beta,beta-carotene 9',10'-oxygenase-like n=1 Tax=Saccoglossus kowalevskii TaxID=10224 RepID=A0ABM0GLL2_SACKO
TIPEWLNGSFLRNGPGLFEIGEDSFNHLFDGMALLHKFTVKDGKVTYQNRFLTSDTYRKNKAANRIVVSEFGTLSNPDPAANFVEKMLSYVWPPVPEDNCNISWFKISEKFCVCTETPFVWQVDPHTLVATKKHDLAKKISIHTMSSHPHTLKDGTLLNVGNHYGPAPTYNVIKISPSEGGNDPFENTQIICSIPARYRLHPGYYHSLSITENYVVFLEQPLMTNVAKLMTGRFTSTPLSGALEYDDNISSIFYLIRHDTGELVASKYVAEPFFSFHHVNAFEDGDHVVVDLCCHRDMDIVNKMSRNSIEANNTDPANIELRRYVFPLNVNTKSSTGTNLITLDYTSCCATKRDDGNDVYVTYEKMIEKGMELPITNYERYNGRKYRYVYGVSDSATELMKVDLQNKTYKLVNHDAYFPAEPVFVEAPNATSEDDGVVMACMVSAKEDTWSYLLVLDGKTFTEIARAEIPVALTSGLHGMFFKGIV